MGEPSYFSIAGPLQKKRVQIVAAKITVTVQVVTKTGGICPMLTLITSYSPPWSHQLYTF